MYDYYCQYDSLISPAEAADWLGCGMNSIYKLLKSNRLKGLRIGRSWRVPKRAVQEFIVKESQMKAAGW